MEIVNKSKLQKLKTKNRGNTLLCEAIDSLIVDIEASNWKNATELVKDRPDADRVHTDGFYFFNINVHRTMILIEFEEEEAQIVWVGSHDEYELTFKNNKNTIEKWLRTQEYIK